MLNFYKMPVIWPVHRFCTVPVCAVEVILGALARVPVTGRHRDIRHDLLPPGTAVYCPLMPPAGTRSTLHRPK